MSDYPDERPQDVIDFTEELDGLLDDERFHFAFDTLGGIRSTIQRQPRVTPGQYLAVKNIRTSVEQRESGDGPAWKRRYEGR